MQEIGDFLERLGMPEYGERFAENEGRDCAPFAQAWFETHESARVAG